MLNNWFILTMIVTISIGIVAFINKIFAQKKYNVQLSALVLYFIMFCISCILLPILGVVSLSEIGYKNLTWCILWGTQFYLYSIIMMSALKYLPTSTYFISVRLSSSFILLGAGILFFGDVITSKELLGFMLGISAMLLLFESNAHQKSNFKKGGFFLLLGIGALVFGHTITKLLSLELEHVPTLLSLAFFSAFITALVFGRNHIKSNLGDIRPIIYINLVQSFFYLIYFYFLFQVYNLGDLGISYKIQSYSPFIPIILAAIFYRENITNKQFLGIAITAMSLYFFA